MLRCTYCHDDFDLNKSHEFLDCPSCEIGILVGEHFAKTDESAFYQPDPNELVTFNDDAIICYNENCDGLCGNVHLDPFSDDPVLSFDDLDNHEIVLLGLNLEEGENFVRPYTYIIEMNERFLHTFIDGCFVPA